MGRKEAPSFHPKTVLPEVDPAMKLVKFHGEPVLIPDDGEEEVIYGGQFTKRQVEALRELAEMRLLLQQSRTMLPTNSFISEDGTEIRTIEGINLEGSSKQRGRYSFSEFLNGNLRYILKQDTLGEPITRGVVITGLIIIETVGSTNPKDRKLALDLLKGFVECKRFLSQKSE